MIQPDTALADSAPGIRASQLEAVNKDRDSMVVSPQTGGHRQRLPVRLTRSVFDDLSIWMISVGVIIGAVFPPMLVGFGVPREIAITPFFFGVCLLAGIMVGAVNIRLMRVVVMPRLRALVDSMRLIESVVERATYTGDWTDCDPESCQLPVDSDDVIGESADAFNHLIRVLQHSHEVEERVGEFSKTMTSQLELGPLCNGALSGFIAATKASAGAIIADVGGELSILASFGIVEADRLCENDHVRLALQTMESVYISRHGSGHTESIIATEEDAVARFQSALDSAIILHNASTQFADGGEFGMGAEIGIATGRIHARGPVGAEQLTSYKYLVAGAGQTRA